MEGQAGKLMSRFLRSVGLGSHSRQVGLGQAATGSTSAAGDSLEDCLECPVCWEGFNAGDNTPYVLFCGHTLCRSCLMGLQWATLKFPSMQIQLPLLISCPWCQFLTLRIYWKGNRLKFPSKNFFLLSLVESIRGHDSSCKAQEKDEQGKEQGCGSTSSSKAQGKVSTRRLSELWQVGFSVEQRRDWATVIDGLSHGNWGSNQLMKLISLVVQLIAKLPLICLLLFIVLYVLPFSALALVIYCLITLVLAVPAYLVLYFSYPSLQWLAREIAAA